MAKLVVLYRDEVSFDATRIGRIALAQDFEKWEFVGPQFLVFALQSKLACPSVQSDWFSAFLLQGYPASSWLSASRH